MNLHHVIVAFPNKTVLSTFMEGDEDEVEKISERLAFYKDHGAVTFWQIVLVERQHDLESMKRAIDSRVDPKQQGQPRDEDWPYDWPKPDV